MEPRKSKPDRGKPVLPKPISSPEVGAGSCDNWQRDKFGHIVRMEALDGSLQLRQAFSRRLDEQQPFLCGLHLALPAINGGNRTGKNVRTSGQARFDKGARDAPRLPGARA